jgi:hypothetical protein
MHSSKDIIILLPFIIQYPHQAAKNKYFFDKLPVFVDKCVNNLLVNQIYNRIFFLIGAKGIIAYFYHAISN